MVKYVGFTTNVYSTLHLDIMTSLKSFLDIIPTNLASLDVLTSANMSTLVRVKFPEPAGCYARTTNPVVDINITALISTLIKMIQLLGKIA